MRVPPVVESGKHPHVILDCDYDLTENEGRQVRILSFRVVRDEFSTLSWTVLILETFV
jgi:hypothetical protein